MAKSSAKLKMYLKLELIVAHLQDKPCHRAGFVLVGLVTARWEQ